MNRNLYRLVFNTTLGMMVPSAENARRQGKAASALNTAGAVLASVVLSANPAMAVGPQGCGATNCGPGVTGLVQAGSFGMTSTATQTNISIASASAIGNFKSFNVSADHTVILNGVAPVTNFLARIYDNNATMIQGRIQQGAGGNVNMTMVNTNGIAFMGGSQVNLNSFTASSLNIADNFVLNNLLGDNSKPQFEGTGGFVKVFEGAKITAGSQGRVMLIAPTVVNKGTIEAPDGQIILAAGTKVYLRSADDGNLNVRGLLVEVDSPAGVDTANTAVTNGVLDGQSVALADATTDKLGHATNLGELSTPRGNVTMVGYAVNQKGIARATSSVLANGSIYLMAKDTSVLDGSSRDSSRGGRVILGENSLTQVLPETNDATTSVDGKKTGAGMAQASEVHILGQTIDMAGSAVIDAPSAKVDLIAVDHPNTINAKTTFGDSSASALASAKAWVHLASGARINVAGLNGVAVSAARNTVEVELRGDELKDSPINQQGPLRGEKVYVDIAAALANANAGKSTLIAKDSLESYQAKLERTVAERSTAAGTVNIRSQGQTILESGSVIDLSGGSMVYTAANVKTTQLNVGDKLVNIADATADTRYDGISTRYVIDYGRWNKKEVIDLPQTYRYDPGYTEGKNAGTLSIQSMGAAYMQADIQGRTTVGDGQRAAGAQPTGATLEIGTNSVGDSLRDYKINQKVVIDRATASLPVGFKAGDALPADLLINAALLAKDKVANLKVYTNQAAEVRTALRAPQGGSVIIAANDLTVKANIQVQGGAIDLAARNNVYSSLNDTVLKVDDGVQLTALGAWVNERSGTAAGDASLALLDGGSISLVADAKASGGVYESRGTVQLGQGVTIDASGGARVSTAGKITAGKGGMINIAGYAVEGLANNVFAYGLEKGGKITVSANRIKVGGAAENAFGTLMLDPLFFSRGGFADVGLTALSTLEVAQNTTVRAQLVNRELLPSFFTKPTGGSVADVSRLMVRDDSVRQAVNISLAAKQSGAGTGEVLIGQGARVEVNPKGTIAIEAHNTVDIEGALVAHGGSIEVVLDRSKGQVNSAVNQNALWLGSAAQLDVSGVARTYSDNQGLIQGDVLSGGTVNLIAKTGYVVAQEGSRINVSGAAPVRLDVLNERGGLGRVVGSDAGTLTVAAEEGILFDATLAANAGGASNRGGKVSVTLSKSARTETQGANWDADARTLSLANSVASQTTGMSANAPIPVTGVVRARIATDKLEAAGFDSMEFSSRDAIVLEDGLNLGAGSSRPMRELTLDAARIETAGGNVALRADTLRMGNYDTNNRVGADGTFTTTGTLTANARLLELAGNLRLRGMAVSELTGTEMVQVSGVTRKPLSGLAAYEHSATIETTADLTLKSTVIAPSSYATTKVVAAGKTVRFAGVGNTPFQPLSALGKLRVEAADIVQGGNLWAPLGQVDLVASNALTLTPGGLTSVAAARGSVIPLGLVQNGSSWVVNLDAAYVTKGQVVLDREYAPKGTIKFDPAYLAQKPATVPAPDNKQIAFEVLPEKSVRLSGATVTTQAGATVDISGGGDIQAYEFTAGPGGSRDILSDANTYAVLPGYKGGFAPANPQDKLDRASGESVYLSGVPGLADGVYTLLPAHYALMPGAMAVRLNSTASVMPGQAYTRADGIRVASGYVTDSRANAPRDADWRGIEVLTRDQVRARSELALTSASDFFKGGSNLPQDAGLLSMATQGVLTLDATFRTAGAAGGRGAAVDISAPNLAITSGSPTGIDAGATRIEVDKLNALGASSLLLGATRARSGDTTTLTVGANNVMLANDATHALAASEVILAAKDTLTLRENSVIDAQGATGDVGLYTTAGNGALVRAASTSARFERTGSPDRSQGTLSGDASSVVRAADSLTFDATKSNAFKGNAQFKKSGVAVAGNLAVGAGRVNFGAAPVGADGISYSQDQLTQLSGVKSLALNSYSTFDVYGDVTVGAVDANGKPVLQNLTLNGAGLAGISNSGKTATLNAQNLTVSNSAAVAFAAGGALGDGALAIKADTLTLGTGDKAVQGYSAVTATANELIGVGTGAGVEAAKTAVAAPITVNVARIRGEKGANQTLTSTGALVVANRVADRVLAPVTALGAKWALTGTRVDFNSHVELPSGQFSATATAGNVTLGATARVDVSGRSVAFYDVSRSTWGGTVQLTSDTGKVTAATGSNINVSGAAGADGGTLTAKAINGTVELADGSVTGQTVADADGKSGEGARAEIDAGKLENFSATNTALNTGGFDGARTLRARTGAVAIAATDTVKAKTIKITADAGAMSVAGRLNASGAEQGRIELYANNNVDLLATAKLSATSSTAKKDGGDIEVGTSVGSLNLITGSQIDVTGGSGGRGGSVLLRAPRVGATDVAVTAVNSTIAGARAVSVEAVKVYSNINTLTATGASSGSTLSLASVNTDNTTFATKYSTIKTRLGKTGDATFHLLAGAEVRSTGDLTLGTGTAATDWNLATSRPGADVGVLTLRAAGNLNINSNLSDGFSIATALDGSKIPATLVAGDSWSYRLIAGADTAAAGPMAVTLAKDFTLAAGKFIRTGTGNIQVAAGQDIKLTDTGSVIYTAGRASSAVANFTVPAGTSTAAYYTQDGGDVSLVAVRDLVGKESTQLYSDWLFRQGALNDAGTAYTLAPTWWVRFDQFKQGVGALGGGDVTLKSGGQVKNVSASTPTQGRMASLTPDASAMVKTGGGTVRVEAGTDVLGGQYYADNGDVLVKAGGAVASGQAYGTALLPVYTILALGDGVARVQALNGVNIHAIINPQLLSQSEGSTELFNVNSRQQISRKSFFSTYSENSGATLQSLSGAVTLQNPASSNVLKTAYKVLKDVEGLTLLPSNLSAVSFQGDVVIHDKAEGGSLTLSPSSLGQLELLAKNSVQMNAIVSVSDSDQSQIASAAKPVILSKLIGVAEAAQSHASTPTHVGDTTPVRVYAVDGDVAGVSTAAEVVGNVTETDKPSRINVPKLIAVRAGRDVRNFTVHGQNVNDADHSVIEAGRDIVFSAAPKRTDDDGINIGGRGTLELTAGRNVDLGTSGGIVSRGDLDNSNLSSGGVNIQVLAGAGAKGLDVAGTLSRLTAKFEAGAADESTLWLARWLTGDTQLSAGNALAAMRAVGTQGTDAQRVRVRELVFTALRETGRGAITNGSTFAGDYARGYAALELVFPGISEKNSDGTFKNYQGDLNLFASRIKTERGGNIEFMLPGGRLIAGLANTADALVKSEALNGNVLGIVAAAEGNIKGFARGNMLVNQSRILTVGGGDVLLWSSEGDIDAGKGKKTASAAPPPVITVKSDGTTKQELQGAVSGSGIGALSSGGVKAGDVDLYASKGTINAGDAGIRAGNFFGGAAIFLNSTNMQVSGSSAGTPVADTSAVTATASGATSAGGDISNTIAALNKSSTDSAKSAQAMEGAFKPSFVRVDVVGFGE